MSSSDSVSIKELASKLKISDALIKKMIKDFEIETIRNQKRVQLSPEAVQTIRDILALRASGKKNVEIKQLFDEAQKGKKTTTADNQVQEPEIEQEAEQIQAKKIKKIKPVKPAAAKPEALPTAKEETNPEIQQEQAAEELSVEGLSANDILELSAARDLGDIDVLDASGYLDDEEAVSSHDQLKELLSMEGNDDEDLDDEDDNNEQSTVEEVDQNDDRLSPRKIRRRQFSFRYIQRQIANDSKRVNYIKQKLRRGSISVKERMTLEDSLQHRSLLLSGWIQLLRWVKS